MTRGSDAPAGGWPSGGWPICGHGGRWLRLAAVATALATAAVEATRCAAGNDPPLQAGAAPAVQPAAPRDGLLVRIAAPISNNVAERAIQTARTFIAQCKQQQKWPYVVFEIEPGPSPFGMAYHLAREIVLLDGATTVAFVPPNENGEPQALRGHAVLVAMACQQIVLVKSREGRSAFIGEAGAGEQAITPAYREAYREIARSRLTIPEALALGMLDPAVRVWRVDTPQARGVFMTDEQIKEQEATTTIVKAQDADGNPLPPVVDAGEMGLFTGEQALALGLVSHLVSDRRELADVLRLPPTALEVAAADGSWRPVEVRIEGELTARRVESIRNIIRKQIDQHDANLIILTIHSTGGAPGPNGTRELAKFLAGLKYDQHRTVAYVPQEARGDAAFIVMACDHVLMHPDAVLGGGIDLPEEEIPTTVVELTKICELKHKPASLWAAMVDPDLTVYRYVHKKDGRVAYLSEAEAAAQGLDQWERHEAVTQRGRPLRVTGDEALRLELANNTVDGFGDVKAIYGLQRDPRQVEPSWIDELLGALMHPQVLWALLVIGGTGLYFEMQSPGTGIGGFIACVCFLVFFWGTYLEGTAGWLEILLFVAGLVFLLLEIFVLPGFGIFGLGGALMVLLSIIMAMETYDGLPMSGDQLRKLQRSLLIVAAAGGAIVALIAALHRFLPHTPGVSRLVLQPPSGAERSAQQLREAVASYDHLLGSRGVALTRLTPSGKARIGGAVYNVVSQGDFVDPDKPIVVVSVHGNRIVVAPPEE